eukprot:scaffold57283_cov39-Prasinocladus_malaysianus.AAC.1
MILSAHLVASSVPVDRIIRLGVKLLAQGRGQCGVLTGCARTIQIAHGKIHLNEGSAHNDAGMGSTKFVSQM